MKTFGKKVHVNHVSSQSNVMTIPCFHGEVIQSGVVLNFSKAGIQAIQESC